MIIYRDEQPPLLSDYGIEVPMLKSRAQKVRDEILSNFGEDVFVKAFSPILSDEDILRAHTPGFLKRSKETPQDVIVETFELINPDGSFHRFNPQSARRPLSDLVEIFRKSCADTYLGLLKAGENGFSYYLGGGFHHSLSTKGRGFCLFNDIVIAARKYQKEISPANIWVIDIDAHKGCGTAEMTENDPSISTLSIHMKHGWPLDSGPVDSGGKQFPWFIPSTVDVEIDSGEEEYYLAKLRDGLNELAMKSPSPQLCIVVDGSDPYVGDALPSAGLLKLSKEQCLERNKLVFEFLRFRNIPQAYVMSGGYGEKNWIIHYQFISHVLNQMT